jgi:uncharacterized MnhB-related membrane protein
LEALSVLTWLLDGLLCGTLLLLGWKVLTSPDLYEAIILFMAFGLLMALAWARLGAVDVAMAEAAIGAGVTGALFLTTLAKLRDQHAKEHE